MRLNCAFLGIATSLSSLVHAQNQQAAVFISNLGQSDKAYNLTFAINTHDSRPDDLFFYLSAPKSNQWTGVGFGSSMKGALMFITYTDGEILKFSPRIASGHSEPTFANSIDYVLFNNSGIFNDVSVARGVCHNCTRWQGGSVDFDSPTSPFIYAVGPKLAMGSSAPDADLRRHDLYGTFTMNLLAARGDPAGFPTDLSKSDNATANGGVTEDHEYGSAAHALIMACVFVILFPFGAAYLRLQSSVKWHWIAQAIGIIGAIVGTGIALNISQMYNRSKHYNSAHQLIGFLALAFLLVQATLGSIHHWVLFKKTPHPSNLSRIHRFLGPSVVLLGIVNGGIGFSFASAHRSRFIGYGLLILFVAILIAGSFFWKIRRDQRKAPYESTAAQNFQSAYISPQYQNDIPLRRTGTPPPYSPSRPLYP